MPRVLAIAQFIVFALGTMALHIFRKLEYVPQQGQSSLEALLIGDSLWVACIPIAYLGISEMFLRRERSDSSKGILTIIGVIILLSLVGTYAWKLVEF